MRGDPTVTDGAPWHPGELAVQRRLGATRERPGLRRTVPPAGVAFLAARTFVVASAVAGSSVWTTTLTGPPGYVEATSDRVVIRATPHPDDPLAVALAGPARIGLLAIEPATRRRMRINGRSRPVGDGLVIEPDQVVANCPKYIVSRSPAGRGSSRTAARDAPGSLRPIRGRALTDEQVHLLSAADTFFIGTADERGNADSSHRGGEPGFVQVLAPDRLRFADFAGNQMYLTLGNLERRPEVGLLFVDWNDGTTVHLSGRAHVDWDAPTHRSTTGREIHVEIDEVVQASEPLFSGWSLPDPAA